MITLTENEQATLEGIVKNNATDQPYRVIIFGSRATGKAKKYSDVDLALIGQGPVPNQTIAYLSEAFDNSSLPYTVDIVDFTLASPSLQDQIEKHGLEIIAL
jgi:predicted nucleotidyltransferase